MVIFGVANCTNDHSIDLKQNALAQLYSNVIKHVQWQFLARDEGDAVSTKPGIASLYGQSAEPVFGRWDFDTGQSSVKT